MWSPQPGNYNEIPDQASCPWTSCSGHVMFLPNELSVRSALVYTKSENKMLLKSKFTASNFLSRGLSTRRHLAPLSSKSSVLRTTGLLRKAKLCSLDNDSNGTETNLAFTVAEYSGSTQTIRLNEFRMNEDTVSTLKRSNGEVYLLRVLTNFKPSAMVLDEHESTTYELGLILISNEQGLLTEWTTAWLAECKSSRDFIDIGFLQNWDIRRAHGNSNS
jgi:hypothetical protein